MSKRKCAEQGCDREFDAVDPRAIFCNRHHFLFLANLGAAVQEGKSPMEAVAEGLARVAVGKKGGDV